VYDCLTCLSALNLSTPQGLTPPQVSDETLRTALGRLGINWKRAKPWITSPDPAYGRKKRPAIG